MPRTKPPTARATGHRRGTLLTAEIRPLVAIGDGRARRGVSLLGSGRSDSGCARRTARVPAEPGGQRGRPMGGGARDVRPRRRPPRLLPCGRRRMGAPAPARVARGRAAPVQRQHPAARGGPARSEQGRLGREGPAHPDRGRGRDAEGRAQSHGRQAHPRRRPAAFDAPGPSAGSARRARRDRCGDGARDLHAVRAAGPARSADPAGGLSPRHRDDEGARRGDGAHHPVPADSVRHQWELRARAGHRALPAGRSLCGALGGPCRSPAIHSVRRGGERHAAAHRAGPRRVPRLESSAADRRRLPGARAHGLHGRGAVALRPERRRVTGRAPRGGHLLDLALGIGRPLARHAADRLSHRPQQASAVDGLSRSPHG